MQLESNERKVASATFSMTAKRILLLALLGQLMMNLDRGIIGFAALEMNKDLAFSPEVFGFGAGIFFFGYICFEIPSNFALRRWSAPLWLGRIMVTWGLVTCGFAWVSGEYSFYTMRFLLGVAEAGFTPGVMYFFCLWFAGEHRGRVVSLFLTGACLAGVIAGPISAVILPHTLFAYKGWQLLFIVIGLPAVILGILYPILLPKDPESSKWLPEENKAWLKRELAKEGGEKGGDKSRHDFLHSLKTAPIWFYSLAYFCILVGVFSLFFWMPQLIKAAFPDAGTSRVSLLAALPWLAAFVGVIIAGRTTDKTGDRRWHLAFTGIAAGICLLVGVYSSNPQVGLVSFILAMAFAWTYMTAFWPNPMAVLKGAAAAGGLAVINSLGTLGGFVGPYMVGLLRGQTGSFAASICFFAVFFLIAGLIPILAPHLFPHAKSAPVSSSVIPNEKLAG